MAHSHEARGLTAKRCALCRVCRAPCRVFKRNLTYATYILGGAIVLEGVYGTVTDGFWNSVNKGVSAVNIA